MLPKFVLENLLPIFHGVVFTEDRFSKIPGFYDFCDAHGGCRMRIVRNGQFVGCIAKEFKARSSTPGEIVPDLRDEEAQKLMEILLSTLLTLDEAKSELNLTDERTVQTWLCGGSFPGAFCFQDVWFFKREEVLSAKERIADLRERNFRRDLTPGEDGSESDVPLL